MVVHFGLMRVSFFKSSRNLDLQSRLEEQTDENEHLQNTQEALRKTNAEQVKKIDQYIEKLHEVRPQRFIIEKWLESKMIMFKGRHV